MHESLLAFGLVLLMSCFAASGSASAQTNPIVVMETSKGDITIELDAEKAPITVENFLKYVDSGHYNDTIFHRVIPSFMVQGGGFTADNKEKATGRGIKNEGGNGLKNKRGTLAMARTSVPDSATAQFFINLVDNDFLDRDRSQDGFGYAVFGKVIDGMDVVDAISKIPTSKTRVSEGYPNETIFIRAIKRKPATP